MPLSPAAREVLAQASWLVADLFGDRAAQIGWVFPNPNTGKPFIKMQTGWERARRIAGLDGLRIHDLRHSFASVPIPTMAPVCNGIMPPGDSGIMAPPCNGMIPPGRRVS